MATGTSNYQAAGAGLGVLQLGLGFLNAENERAYGAFQERIATFNAKQAERQADLIIEKSRKDSLAVRDQGKQIVAKQRASFASQGIDINSGSALDVQNETLEFSAEDARTVQNNAYLQAMGVKMEAIGMRAQGGYQAAASGARANLSLVNSGVDGALTYMRMNR